MWQYLHKLIFSNIVLNCSSKTIPIYPGILMQVKYAQAEKTGSPYPLWITGGSINSKSILAWKDVIPVPYIINKVKKNNAKKNIFPNYSAS